MKDWRKKLDHKIQIPKNLIVAKDQNAKEFNKELEDYKKMNERLIKKIELQNTNFEGSNSGKESKCQRI